MSESVVGGPASQGYRWPAEWERHAATWLCWPHKPDTWPGLFDRIPPLFADLARLIARYEPLKLVVGSPAAAADAGRRLQGVENIEFLEIPTDDSWIRDFGPVFLQGSGLPPALVDWEYNAWGGKYPPFAKDATAAALIAERENRLRFPAPMVLEPGAIDGNGLGVVLTTASCLLNPNRNPDLTQPQVEQCLRDYLGARRVVWLDGGGIEGDDTDGHIDQTARFVAPQTIVAAYNLDSADPHAQVLHRNVETLRRAADHLGQGFDVKLLFNPPPLFQDGHRLPASYCNFYVLNSAVIVPTFGCDSDDAALAVLQELFPERTIEPFPCRELVWGLGAVHCLTQQEPALGD